MTAGTLRIVGICGSLRRASYNRAMLLVAASMLDPAHEFALAGIGDLPFYDRDVEVVGNPPAVRRLREEVSCADGLLIATPEYNRSIPGALKNALDWLSRAPFAPLDHLPVGVIGGGARGGTAQAQSHVREVLIHNRSSVLEGAEVIVPAVWDAFDPELKLVDARVRSELERFVSAFQDHVRRDVRHRPAVLVLGADRSDARALRALAADYRLVPTAAQRFDAALDRWAPVALVLAGDAEPPDALGERLPVVPLADPGTLPQRLGEITGSSRSVSS